MYEVKVNNVITKFSNYTKAFLFFSKTVQDAKAEGFTVDELNKLGDDIEFIGVNEKNEIFIVRLTTA